MGLLEDILGGMAGAQQPGARGVQPQQAAGGMSPIMMAILALLAQRALAGGQGRGGLADIIGGMFGGGAQSRGAPSGGFSDILGGLLGGTQGSAAGSVLSGGLADLVRQFEQNGQGEAARSWVGRGENKPISPNDLGKVLGPDTVSSLAEQAGLSQIDLLSGLSRQMPGVIDRLTPQGRLPTEDEASRWV